MSNASEAKMDFRILVVDDAPENISLMVNILKDRYQVTTARDGESALEAANKEPQPDLVLLDVLMPDIDGYEVCKRLKADERTRDIPIIFLTVLDEAADITKGFEVGGVDYVTKPFEPTVLLARVKTHCELSLKTKELKRFNEQLEGIVQARSQELLKKDELLRIQSRQAAMGNMIAMIAHQWRQPISVISIIANNILIDMELGISTEPATIKRGMNDIVKNTQYLSNTIENFRDFFRPNKPKEEFFVSAFFELLLSMIGKNLENHNIEFELKIESDGVVSAYKNELLQVMLNLINNAKDAILQKHSSGGKISVSVAFEGGVCKIDVCDNGGGVADEFAAKIGEPYFTTKDEKSGTGLGLYMSRTIVEKHLGGTLGWKNRDDGACFFISIPKG